jgi:hypothetical protein
MLLGLTVPSCSMGSSSPSFVTSRTFLRAVSLQRPLGMTQEKGHPMDALDDVVELHAVYGFTDPIVIDLETVDSEWLDGHCDVVGFARTTSEIPRGLWLEQGYVVEVAETRLVARRDERAVRTLTGPIAFRFTHTEPLTRGEWTNPYSSLIGHDPAAHHQTPTSGYRMTAECDMHTHLARDAPFARLAARRRAPAYRGATDMATPHVDTTNESELQRFQNAGEPDELISAQWPAPA